jgi:hypothetical protein
MRAIDKNASGIVLITTMFLIVVLMALLGSYFTITRLELATTKSSKDSVTGFYTAEAGLNLRAETIRQTFVGYNVPAGVSPSSPDECGSGNLGSGDFACQTFNLSGHNSITYVAEEPGNPITTTIPPGELYQGLNAQEYRYTVTGVGEGVSGKKEAILELRFRSRLVPLFQFAVFYDKDLEILPGPTMQLNGPVHTNGDLYMDTGASLRIAGQITVAGDVFRGRKNLNQCLSNPVQLLNPGAYASLIPACATRTQPNAAQLAAYNGMIQVNVNDLTVPQPDSLDPTPGRIYWDKADLRLVLKLTGANAIDTTNSVTGVEVRNLDFSNNAAATASLHSCTTSSSLVGNRPIGSTTSFRNNREGTPPNITMLEVDMRSLLNCLRSTNWFGTGKLLSDATEGGLVFHFSVDGPDSAVPNYYGVRVRNGDELQSAAGTPAVRGMTIATDQAAYIVGHYNRTNKIPAAVLSDSINILSTNWFAGTGDNKSTLGLGSRLATATTVNSAFLSGTDTTGNIEGVGGQNINIYNGGLENYPRFHERWTNITFTYRGSFVSLGRPRHVDGVWDIGGMFYNAPNRNWDYDTSFNNAANLPPLTPRFVYLRQELFVRKFEQ